jgi:ElaA protein
MEWKTCAWSELDRAVLYSLLQLRSEVFVVEQDCVYQDLDGKDEAAWHVLGFEGDVCVATARVLPPGVSYAEPSIGRVVVKASHRLGGAGRRLMGEALACCLDHWPTAGVRISAQTYLEAFYHSLGFEVSSEPYLEDDLPHVQMHRPGLPVGAWESYRDLPDAVDDWEMAVRTLPVNRLLGAAESWRAGAITDHLVASEEATYRFVAKRCKGPLDALPAIDEAATVRAATLSARLRSTEQYRMPEGLPDPTPIESWEEFEALMARWRAVQSRGRALLAGLPLNWWDAQVFQHPLAGGMGLAVTGAFIADHITHHRHQLQRLVGAE